MTANGATRATEEATENVHDLDICVDVQVLEESPAELSPGKLREKSDISCERRHGEPSYLIRNGSNVRCKIDDYITVVVVGVQSPDPSSDRWEANISCGA